MVEPKRGNARVVPEFRNDYGHNSEKPHPAIAVKKSIGKYTTDVERWVQEKRNVPPSQLLTD